MIISFLGPLPGASLESFTSRFTFFRGETFLVDNHNFTNYLRLLG
jgi:hypothetical protein